MSETRDEWIASVIERQNAIFALQPTCPECTSPQVQVLNMRVTPAEWQCRMCKTYFNAEPSS